MAPHITSKINGFIANEFLRPILSQKKNAFNFRELMDQKKIPLVNLSKGQDRGYKRKFAGHDYCRQNLDCRLIPVNIPEDKGLIFICILMSFKISRPTVFLQFWPKRVNTD